MTYIRGRSIGIYLALALLTPLPAWAQGAILQVGPALKFSPLGFAGDKQAEGADRMWLNDFRGLNPAHHFDNKGTGDCWEDALASGPYHQVCVGHDSAGNAVITVTPQNGAAAGGLNVDLNGSLIPIPVPIPAPGGIAMTNAVLAATTIASFPEGVFRLGVAVVGDAPVQFFKTQSGNCASHSLTNNVGFCVDETSGNSWLAVPPAAGIDLREYGNVYSGNAATLLQTADTDMGAAAWPSTVSKTVLLPAGSMAFGSAVISNIVGLQGVGDYNGTVLTPIALTTIGSMIRYEGAGPFVVSDLEFRCATYVALGAFAQPTNCGNDQLLIEPAANTTQVTEVRTRRVRFVGGTNQLRIVYTNKIDVEIDEISASWNDGVTISQQGNGTGIFTGSARVHVKKCFLTGDYCVTLPANVPQTAAVIFASRDLDVKIDSCVGVGFPNSKGCIDMTTEAGEQVRLEVRAMNVNTGGESKMTDASFANATPQRFSDRFGKVIVTQNFDTANAMCFSLPYPGGASSAPAIPDASLNESFDVTCTFSPATAWIANMPVVVGQVYATSDNNVYQVVQAGTTGATKPTGTSLNTGVADGTAIVSYRAAYSATSTAMTGVLLGANSYLNLNVKVHNVANGVLVRTLGSSDNTLRYVNLTINGEVQRSCLFDTWATPGFGTDQTIDHFTIVGSSCRSLTSNQDAISIGATSGGNKMNWTNLKIVGSAFTGGADALRNNGGSIAGDIIGSRLVAGTSAILTAGATTLNIAGGLLGNTGGVGATGGIIKANSGASGAIVLSNVTVSNSDTGNIATYNPVAGSMTVTGQANNIPPVAAVPSGPKCNAGLDYVAGTVPATGYLFGCSAANTWAKLY